jgi:hypothetical protein
VASLTRRLMLCSSASVRSMEVALANTAELALDWSSRVNSRISMEVT